MPSNQLTPGQEQLSKYIRSYNRNPYTFTNDQVDRLADLAADHRIEFKRHLAHEAEADLGSVKERRAGNATT